VILALRLHDGLVAPSLNENDSEAGGRCSMVTAVPSREAGRVEFVDRAVQVGQVGDTQNAQPGRDPVRPPRLTDKPLTGTYRTAYGQNLRRGLFISRADVAHLMLRALEQPETVKQAIGIAY
jgi:hypothetical protein